MPEASRGERGLTTGISHPDDDVPPRFVTVTLLAHAERREDPVQEFLGRRLAVITPSAESASRTRARDELQHAPSLLASSAASRRDDDAAARASRSSSSSPSASTSPGAGCDRGAERVETLAGEGRDEKRLTGRRRKREEEGSFSNGNLGRAGTATRSAFVFTSSVSSPLPPRIPVLYGHSKTRIDHVKDEVGLSPPPLRDGDADLLDLVLRQRSPAVSRSVRTVSPPICTPARRSRREWCRARP